MPQTTDQLTETVRKALHRAYNLGQTYWQQADSESYAANKRSEETAAKFDQLSAETLAALSAVPLVAEAPMEPVAWRVRRIDLENSPERINATNRGWIKWKPWELHDDKPIAPCSDILQYEPLYAAPVVSPAEAPREPPLPEGWATEALEAIWNAPIWTTITADMKRAASLALRVARGERWDDASQEWGAPPASLAQAPKKLWLWKNFVDGRPEYWAFDNPYPIHLTDGDPQTLGQPCGYALFKPSRDGSCGRTEEQVLREMASVSRVAPPASLAPMPENWQLKAQHLASRYGLLCGTDTDNAAYDHEARHLAWTALLSHLRTAPRPTLSDEQIDRNCEYSGGTCARRGCAGGCQALKLVESHAQPLIPSARNWLDSTSSAASRDWVEGWDACRAFSASADITDAIGAVKALTDALGNIMADVWCTQDMDTPHHEAATAALAQGRALLASVAPQP